MKCNGLLGIGLAAVLLWFHVNLEIQAQGIPVETNENEVEITEEAQTVYGVSLNGGKVSTIQPDRMSTGNEKKEKFPIYTVSYSSKETDCLEQKTRLTGYCGIRIPIKLPEKGQIFVEFTDVQNVKKKDLCMAISSDPQNTGALSADPEFLGTRPIKTDILNSGTYYLVFSTYTDFRPEQASFTTNNLSFRIFYYSAADQTLFGGKWIAMAERGYGENGFDYDRYYKIVLPENGHIQLQSDINRSLAVCDSKKKVLYGNRYELDIDNNYMASYYLKKGTYYIKTRGIVDSVSRLRYNYYKLGAPRFAFQNGKTLKLYAARDQSVVHYIKYKAPATGYVIVTLSGEAFGEVSLCNSSLKVISHTAELHGNAGALSNNVLFGVQKGRTYYLRTSNFFAFQINLRLSAKSIKEKCGSSKKNAVKLQSGKKTEGVAELGNKAGDWYKFTLLKKKSVQITVKGRNNGGMRAILYASSGKKLFDAKTYASEEGNNNAFGLRDGVWNLKKGTYYIKITGKNAKSSGYYTLKWK